MNIRDFKSENGARGGLMRNNRFLVTFATPITLIGNPIAGINRTIEYWCEGASIPDYIMGTSDVRRWSYGPSEKRPFMPNFTQLVLTFQSDSAGQVYSFFDAWMQSILPHNTRNGLNQTFINGRQPYELEYKQNYVTDLHLFVFDIAGDVTFDFVFKEAFPSAMPPIPLNWGDNNSITRFQVAIDFVDWYTNSQQQPIAGIR